jgi:hypothetical protein
MIVRGDKVLFRLNASDMGIIAKTLIESSCLITLMLYMSVLSSQTPREVPVRAPLFPCPRPLLLGIFRKSCRTTSSVFKPWSA